MKIVGIICEYNPFHLGHAAHINNTCAMLGGDVGVVCVMSPNFVQRGDFAVFNKHARAKMAILSGADLVLELPTPYALSSAESFATSGVYILEKLGVCDYISFSSESGDVSVLKAAADVAVSDAFGEILRLWLRRGLSYAAASQKAAEIVLGDSADVFNTPNNVLGIEYIKALQKLSSKMQPITMKRVGGEHDSDTGFSASAVRSQLRLGNMPSDLLPESSISVCEEEIRLGRGPVFLENAELAILSRLRLINDFSWVSGVSDGLEQRFVKAVATASTVDMILHMVKSKRFVMSRLRRVLMCAILGIHKEDIQQSPAYIRILATSKKGTEILGSVRKKAGLPIITKPASVYKLGGVAKEMFKLEVSATDLYALAYENVSERAGGSEWRMSPIIGD